MPVISFSKMHGLGNDFMVIDAVTQRVFINEKNIQNWADRHRGIGFDQLLLIEPPYNPQVDFHYRIFNADGREVEQCGNGARCFARFVYEKKLTPKKRLTVSTLSGDMQLTLDRFGKNTTVFFKPPDFEPQNIGFRAQKRENTYLLRACDETFLCHIVSIGNPHCVIKVADIDQVDVQRIGGALGQNERFVNGANVGFCQVVAPDKIKLRVYERGVGETQSCGTGACAAVALGVIQHQLANKVHVQLTGGGLIIEWLGEGYPIQMTGETQLVYDGQISI